MFGGLDWLWYFPNVTFCPTGNKTCGTQPQPLPRGSGVRTAHAVRRPPAFSTGGAMRPK